MCSCFPQVGSLVINAKGEATAIARITKSHAAIINAVTADGTIVANGVLAASNPLWIAALTIDAPLTRALVNAVLYAAGDVDSVGAGGAKLTVVLAIAAVAFKVRKAATCLSRLA